MNAAVSVAALALFALAAWGWGGLVLSTSFAPENLSREASYRVALGIAALAAVGGWLNLLGIAYAPALWSLLLVGWASGFHFLRRNFKKIPRHAGAHWLPWALAFAAALWLAATLLPSLIFNWDDDLQVYVPRALRMLQTGTLAGNPFDTLGLDSLGTQSFLQAFTLLAFGAQYLNAFDAVFCAALVVSLVICIGRLLVVPLHAVLAAMLALALLHPIQMNISPVYATAALALALVPATFLAATSSLGKRALPAGLLLAALAGVKITNVPFLVLFSLALAPAIGARALLAIAAWAAFFLAPWLLMHAGQYARLGQRGSPGGDPWVVSSPVELLGAPWQSGVVPFNAAALLCAVIAVWGYARWREGEASLKPILALCAAGVGAYLLSPIPLGIEPGIRHSVPVLLAALPVAVLAGAHLLTRAPRWRAIAFSGGVTLVAAYLFAPLLPGRIDMASTFHTIVSFPPDREDLEGVRRGVARGMSGAEAQRIRVAQAQAEPGARIFALVAAPQHLDFARNPVYPVSKLGIAAFWQDAPMEPAAMHALLQRQGVRYVLWEPQAWTEETLARLLEDAYPVDRRAAKRMLSLRRSLEALSLAGSAQRADGLVLLDLGPP